ncbi:MAG: hypothetical protein EZS28_043560, partial [Streblomastix strix]
MATSLATSIKSFNTPQRSITIQQPSPGIHRDLGTKESPPKTHFTGQPDTPKLAKIEGNIAITDESPRQSYFQRRTRGVFVEIARPVNAPKQMYLPARRIISAAKLKKLAEQSQQKPEKYSPSKKSTSSQQKTPKNKNSVETQQIPFVPSQFSQYPLIYGSPATMPIQQTNGPFQGAYLMPFPNPSLFYPPQFSTNAQATSPGTSLLQPPSVNPIQYFPPPGTPQFIQPQQVTFSPYIQPSSNKTDNPQTPKHQKSITPTQSRKDSSTDETPPSTKKNESKHKNSEINRPSSSPSKISTSKKIENKPDKNKQNKKPMSQNQFVEQKTKEMRDFYNALLKAEEQRVKFWRRGGKDKKQKKQKNKENQQKDGEDDNNENNNNENDDQNTSSSTQSDSDEAPVNPQ